MSINQQEALYLQIPKNVFMKFAYLILAHKNPHQLRDMVNVLQDGDNYFFIHIDKKSDISLFINENYTTPDQVFFCTERVDISWGGFSEIEGTMKLIYMLKSRNINPDYIHLLSGQDYPLQTNFAIKDFFKKQNNKSFMEFFPLPYENWSGNGGINRLDYKWIIDEVGLDRAYFLVEAQKQREMKRAYPEGFKPYGGSQWWSLTNECIDHIAQVCVPGNILYEFYKNTFVPDEMLFHTVLLNSQLSDQIINNNLRYIDWSNGPECPRILRMDDLHKLKSSKKMYARKFDDLIDQEVRLLL